MVRSITAYDTKHLASTLKPILLNATALLHTHVSFFALFLQTLDVSQSDASNGLRCIIKAMGGVDLMIISAGTGSIDPLLPWNKEKETIETNVLGFTAMANVAWHHFREKGKGHLVGISSIAAIRGGDAPAYNASKAFVSNYLQGLRYIAAKSKLPITITDIQPGFVGTAMAQGEGLFWVASPQKAASQIYEAIKQKKEIPTKCPLPFSLK